MTFYQNMLEASSRWIDKVAATILLARDLLQPGLFISWLNKRTGTSS
ncbi:MAG: hypothetical protein FWC84_01270 [Alphaproteobacteria bacterium]|nr:hypothetical protein [Alphaproteobacteria bacterium]